jgi:hypothetical protein
MKRRHVLLGSAALVPVALVGCGQTPSQISAEAVQYLGGLETGLNALAPVLASIPGIPAGTVSQAQTYLAEAVTAAGEINAATSQAAGQSAFSQVETYTMDALNLLSGFPLPSNVLTIVDSAKIVLPLIATAISMTGAAVGATAPNPAQVQALTDLQNARSILTGA